MDSEPDRPVTATDLFQRAPEEVRPLIARLASGRELSISDRLIEDTLKHLELQYLLDLDRKMRREMQVAEEAKESERVQALLQEISDLQRKIHLLKYIT